MKFVFSNSKLRNNLFLVKFQNPGALAAHGGVHNHNEIYVPIQQTL